MNLVDSAACLTNTLSASEATGLLSLGQRKPVISPLDPVGHVGNPEL